MPHRAAERPSPWAVHSPWVIWAAGAGVYFFGFIHRASLGVAGPEAITRLDISATQLGSFIMVQLGLYAAMQVPAGVAIDRWGARRVLLAATLAMGAAQVMFAFATSYPLALLARGLLGIGDAAVFIAVLRLAATHFRRRQYAFVTMLTGLTGMLGNLVATVPLVLALQTWGWQTTFLATGGLSIAYALLLLRPAVRGQSVRGQAGPAAPTGLTPPPPAGLAEIRAVWSRPEVRLGFFTHLATLHPGLVLSLLWGFPYLTEGLGYTGEAAASLLSMYIGASLVGSLIIGPLAGRKPGWRTPIALGIAAACTAALAGLVIWPGGAPPAWFVAAVFAVVAIGAPTSQIGFHLARDYNPAGSMSTATGLVNAGGFLGAMGASLAIGGVLDALAGGATPSLGEYRWAMLALVAISLVSTLVMFVSLLGVRQRTLGRIARGENVVVRLRERPWDRAYHRIRG